MVGALMAQSDATLTLSKLVSSLPRVSLFDAAAPAPQDCDGGNARRCRSPSTAPNTHDHPPEPSCPLSV